MNVKLNGHKRIADKLCECFKEKDLEKERENQIKSATEYLFIISERINELTEILKETQTVDK